MNAEGNKAVCRSFLETIFNQGQLSSIWDFVAADAVNYELEALGDGAPPPGQSPEWLADLVFLYRRAFPDLHLEIEGQTGEEDRVVTCLRMRGTQKGPLLGIKPSGRPIDVAGIRVDRLVDGKIAESWFHLDSLAMLRQVGALPEICRTPQPAPRPAGVPLVPLVPMVPLFEVAVWAPGEAGVGAVAS